MRQAAEGHLTTEALMWNQNNDTTISGMTSEDFRQRLNGALKKDGYDIDNNRYPEGYQEAPLAYDAVWSVALGELLLIFILLVYTYSIYANCIEVRAICGWCIFYLGIGWKVKS